MSRLPKIMLPAVVAAVDAVRPAFEPQLVTGQRSSCTAMPCGLIARPTRAA